MPKPITVLGPNFNGTIGHNSSPNQISPTTQELFSSSGVKEGGISQNGMLEGGEPSTIETSRSSIHMIQDRAFQVSIRQVTPDQMGSIQVGISNNSSDQQTALQTDSSQVRSTKIGTSQINFTEIGTSQVDATQVEISQVNQIVVGMIAPLINQLDASKITLPISVTNQQFYSTNFLNHSQTLSIGSDQSSNFSGLIRLPFLSSQFDLSFKIANLPTGQLAEAQITQFDTQGVPIAVTLLLDDDANGLGWFIDSTPWKNSEFATQTTDSACKSTPGSAAYGHYDLLTTILHELGHIARIITGNQIVDLDDRLLFVEKTGDVLSVSLEDSRGEILFAAVYKQDEWTVQKFLSESDRTALLNRLQEPQNTSLDEQHEKLAQQFIRYAQNQLPELFNDQANSQEPPEFSLETSDGKSYAYDFKLHKLLTNKQHLLGFDRNRDQQKVFDALLHSDQEAEIRLCDIPADVLEPLVQNAQAAEQQAVTERETTSQNFELD